MLPASPQRLIGEPTRSFLVHDVDDDRARTTPVFPWAHALIWAAGMVAALTRFPLEDDERHR